MKIAVDARIIYTSTGRYVERLLHHLQELDTSNEYVVMLLAKDFDRWQPTAPNFSKVVADYPPYTFAEQVNFAVQLYKLQADVVHFTMPNFPILYFRPHVTTVHDLTLITFINKRKLGLLKGIYKNVLKPFVFKLIIWLIVHGSREIITPTEYVKGEIVRRLRVKDWRITVTYESAEVSVSEAEEYSQLKDEKYILYVGNAYPYKNLEQLINAFALIKDSGHKLVLVGKKDFFYEQLEKSTQEENIQNVIFTGFVSDEELTWLYANATCFVFPSLSEGFGLPGLEAMLLGLPVAASNATSLPEVYGNAAIYFDPNDPIDIADKVSGLINNPSLRKQLALSGSERVAHFSWERMARLTMAVYKDAVRKRKFGDQ